MLHKMQKLRVQISIPNLRHALGSRRTAIKWTRRLAEVPGAWNVKGANVVPLNATFSFCA